MTLVLAKERTVEAIREALFANRTIAWFDESLAGKKEYLKAFFEESVETNFYEQTKNGKNYILKTALIFLLKWKWKEDQNLQFRPMAKPL